MHDNKPKRSPARAFGIATILCAAACLSGCGRIVDNAPEAINGWDTYGYAAAITCGARPVLLTADRLDVQAAGPCRMVRVAGNHNDVSVEVAPGGTIEITGSHNDVTWHGPPGMRVRPVLLNHGNGNEFHAPA